MADAWILLNEYADYPPAEALTKARAAALKALELAPDLADAHASLAMCKFCQDWDWDGADAEFQRAINLNPSYTTAHHWHANLLSAVGRLDDARSELERAIQIDGLSPITRTALGWRVYASGRQYDKAMREIQAAIELEPHFEFAHRRLGTILLLAGRHEEGLAEMRRGVSAENPSAMALSDLGHACAVAGRTEEARKILDHLLRLSSSQYVEATRIALVYLGLGEKNQAISWLEKARERRDVGLLVVRADPRFETLRGEPRYRELLRAMRFAE